MPKKKSSREGRQVGTLLLDAIERAAERGDVQQVVQGIRSWSEANWNPHPKLLYLLIDACRVAVESGEAEATKVGYALKLMKERGWFLEGNPDLEMFRGYRRRLKEDEIDTQSSDFSGQEPLGPTVSSESAEVSMPLPMVTGPSAPPPVSSSLGERSIPGEILRSPEQSIRRPTAVPPAEDQDLPSYRQPTTQPPRTRELPSVGTRENTEGMPLPDGTFGRSGVPFHESMTAADPLKRIEAMSDRSSPMATEGLTRSGAEDEDWEFDLMAEDD